MGSFVDNYYSVEKFQAAYAGIIPSITDREQWPKVEKGFKCQPPVQKPREVGRQRKNRLKSARETGSKPRRQVRCPNCKEYGHRAGSWKCPLTGTKKRKRTKKKNPQVGRKKAKTGESAAESMTPRTRGALAREAAAKAKREALEAEVKAAAARAAAEAAVREEIEANRHEFVPAREEPVLEVMALEVIAPEEPSDAMTARRALFQVDGQQAEPVKKLTPRKKQLATKVKKTPPKKKGGGKGKGKAK